MASGPSAPDYAPLARADGRLRVAGTVPADLALLDGHFPGHPIVPGFAQVHWAWALAVSELGVPPGIEAFTALKFPQPLLPGRSFELEVRSDRDVVHFRLEAGGETCSQGRLQPRAALSRHPPEAARSDAGCAPLRLPHAGAMRLLDRVVRADAGSTTCTAVLRADAPLRAGSAADGEVSPCIAIELLAQAMAAHGGLARPETAAPQRGFLVASRRLELRTRGFRVGERLWVRADHVRGEVGMVAFRAALGTGPVAENEAEATRRALACGALAAFVEPDAKLGPPVIC